MSEPIIIVVDEFNQWASEKWVLYASGPGPDGKRLRFEASLMDKFRVTLRDSSVPKPYEDTEVVYEGYCRHTAAAEFNKLSR